MTSVEARILAATLVEVKSDIGEIRSSVAQMQRALDALVRIDEAQGNLRSAVSRAFDEIKDERTRREDLDKRMRILETDAPSYKELRRWVIGGVLTGIAMMGAALFKVWVADPLDRGYARPAYVQPERPHQ